MNVVVIGHARHGKDTFCEHIDLTFQSTSKLLAKVVVYPLLEGFYSDVMQCYKDRNNHRALWFNLLKAYNKDDELNFAQEVFKHSSVYCGVRNADELIALKKSGLVDLVVWIDASERLPLEPSDSITVCKGMADYAVENNGSVESFMSAIHTFNCYLEYLKRTSHV